MLENSTTCAQKLNVVAFSVWRIFSTLFDSPKQIRIIMYYLVHFHSTHLVHFLIKTRHLFKHALLQSIFSFFQFYRLKVVRLGAYESRTTCLKSSSHDDFCTFLELDIFCRSPIAYISLTQNVNSMYTCIHTHTKHKESGDCGMFPTLLTFRISRK